MVASIRIKYPLKKYKAGVNDLFTNMFEGDRDSRPDHRLHLTGAPVGTGRVPHDHARFQKDDPPC